MLPASLVEKQGMRDNKILSQAEIEALLNDESMMGGDDESIEPTADDILGATDIPFGAPATMTAVQVAKASKPAKLYDFRRPDKFSKEHLRSLRILHESFARLLGQSLTSYLSAGVQVRL